MWSIHYMVIAVDHAGQVRKLIREASHAEAASSRAPDVVPFCKKILEIIHRNPSLKPRFEAEFLESCRTLDNGYLIVQYCMHELRWLSTRGVFESRLEDAVRNDESREVVLTRHVLDSFDADWEGREQFGS